MPLYNDAATTYDSGVVTYDGDFAFILTDGLGATDPRTVVITVVLTDPLGLIDSMSSVGTLTDARTDSLGLTDSFVPALQLTRSHTDALGVADPLTTTISITTQRPLSLVGAF